MKKINKKGFTLIELMAVITIMGILMIVAIPAVTRTIENSRKDTFIDTVKQYVNGAKSMWAANKLICQATNDTYPSSAVPTGTYYIKVDSNSSLVPQLLEQGGKSPWGNRDMKGYIQVEVENYSALYGDVNLDGKVDTIDFNTLFDYINGRSEITFDVFLKKIADVTGDGDVKIGDAMAISYRVSTPPMISKFPVEKYPGEIVKSYNVKFYPVISDDVHGVNLVKNGDVSTANTTLTASDDLKRGSITMSGMTYYTPSLTNLCVES